MCGISFDHFRSELDMALLCGCGELCFNELTPKPLKLGQLYKCGSDLSKTSGLEMKLSLALSTK